MINLVCSVSYLLFDEPLFSKNKLRYKFSIYKRAS